MHLPSAWCYFLFHQSKYFLQHPALQRPTTYVLSSISETKFDSRIKQTKKYSFVYFNLYISIWLIGSQKILNCRAASILQI